MLKKILIATLSLLLSLFLNGCATIMETMTQKYGMSPEVFAYEGATYKVATNDRLSQIFIKEDVSFSEKAFSPKYGQFSKLLDMAGAFDRDLKMKQIADAYLFKNKPSCKTTSDKPEQCEVECYEFKYICSQVNSIDPKKRLNPNKFW